MGLPDDDFQGKVAPSLAALERRVRGLRRAGRRIVFTNGGFDILHVGHVRSLNDARSRGDHLVVAVNSDRAILASKGSGRPIFPAEERVEVLSALACVDSIIVFDDPTADRIIERLRPDIHAKGPDYSSGPPEEATVRSYGGEVAIVGDPKGHSTSEVIARIRKVPEAAAAAPGEEKGEEN